MSKISYPQLVKNIADAFRIATGTTEPIAIGELTNKIGEAISSGGGGSGEDYTEVYSVMSKETPTENTEAETINFIGLLLGVDN